MAPPLPEDWKIIGMEEDVTFSGKETYSKSAFEDAEAVAPAKSKSSELQKRIISAVVLAPLVLGAVAAGGAVFYTIVIMLAIFMMREWDAINQHRFSQAWGAAGVVYVTATCLSFICLREESMGGSLSLLLFLLAVIWATDIGAYFVGRQIGGPKLAPKISPGKTWAGLIGGMVIAACISCVLSVFFLFPSSVEEAVAVGAVLAVVAQAGDLFESWMKRKAGMKDSGSLIPGHGGILDRVDGLTFTAPLLVILHYLIHLHPASSL